METGSAIYEDISRGHNRRVKTTGWQVERPTKHKVQNNLFLEISFFGGSCYLKVPLTIGTKKVPTLIKVLRTSLLVMLPFQMNLSGCKLPLKINSVYLNDYVRAIYCGHMTVPI